MVADIVFNILLSAFPVIFLSLSVWIMFRVLGEFDLSVDALFTTGAAVFGLAVLNGLSPWLGLVLAALCGAAGAALSITLHLRLHIPVLLATLILLTGLYSLNLHLLGGSTVNLMRVPSIFDGFGKDEVSEIGVLAALSIMVGATLYLFFHTRFGLAMRAGGANSRMARSFGINTSTTLLVGTMISEALAAVGGALQAQVQGFSDVNMGVGSIVIGASAILLGELLFRSRQVIAGLLAVAIGSCLYETVLVLALRSGLPPQDLKLVTAVILVVAILLSSGYQRIFAIRRKLRDKALPPSEGTNFQKPIREATGRG